MSKFDDASARDIDIAKPRPKWWNRRIGFCSWLPWLVVGLLLVFFFFTSDDKWRIAYPLLLLCGIVVFVVAVSIGWQLIFRHGILTWMRLARMPAKAMARGDAVGAERAFAAAAARARRFSPRNRRRGLMLLELTGYLKNLGRCVEAKTFFEESVEILGQRWQSYPLEYLIASNNQAAYLIDVHDFDAGQRILERVLDLTLLWSKGGIKPAAPAATVNLIEFVLHYNLVVLCVRVEELAAAADHLEEAGARYGKLYKVQQRHWSDLHHGIRALLLHAQGRFSQAANELDMVKNPLTLMCVSVRAKLDMAAGDFSKAEDLLRKCIEREGKHGSSHRPELGGHLMDLAESLFGQSKYDEAFKALAEGLAISHDFATLPTPAWRRVLPEWRNRAQQLGRTADVALLETELQKMASTPEQAITLSDRLRTRAPMS